MTRLLLILLLSSSLLQGVDTACSGTELRSLAASNDFVTAVLLEPDNVCNSLDYTNKDLISVTVAGVDKSDALFGSSQGKIEGNMGDILRIMKADGLPFGIGTVVMLTVSAVTKIRLLSPETQEELIPGGTEDTDVSFILTTAGDTIEIEFTESMSLPIVNYHSISVDDCQDGNVINALSGAGTALMLLVNNPLIPQLFFGGQGSASFSIDTAPTLYVLGVSQVVFTAQESASNMVIHTDTKTITDVDTWTLVTFDDLSVTGVGGVTISFTYATNSISNVPIVREVLLIACIPDPGKCQIIVPNKTHNKILCGDHNVSLCGRYIYSRKIHQAQTSDCKFKNLNYIFTYLSG